VRGSFERIRVGVTQTPRWDSNPGNHLRAS